jgi:hypothetical protein
MHDSPCNAVRSWVAPAPPREIKGVRLVADVLMLTVLKFATLAIALASTVWGLTRKTTFEDRAGQKRLTPAGHVAIALAGGAFIVAATSQGLETLAKQAQSRNDQLARSAALAREEARAAREFRNEQRAQRSLDLQLLAREESRRQNAETRAAQAEQRLAALKLAGEQRLQRFLVLQTAAEQRHRELALAEDVNRASRENLQRAEAALSELRRLAQPIADLTLTAEWEIPLRGAVRHFQTRCTRPDGGHSLEEWMIPEESPERWVLELFRGAVFVSASLFAGEPRIIGSRADPTEGDIEWRVSEISPLPRPPMYQCATDSIRIGITGRITNPSERTGRIISVADLDVAWIGVNIFSNSAAVNRMPRTHAFAFMDAVGRARPLKITLATGGRTYELLGARLLRRQHLWIAPLVGSAPSAPASVPTSH